MPELAQNQNENKQIGCMSTFLQIFDRHLILAGKRIHSAKRLPPSTDVGASPETVNSGDSPEFCQKLVKPELQTEKNVVGVVTADADNFESSPAKNEDRRRISPATFKPKEMTKVDAGDNQRRPASVIARLMGLEPLTSDQKPPQTVTKPAVPRSGSEFRVSRDRVRPKYIDIDNFQVKQPNKSQKAEYVSENLKSESSRSTSSSRSSRSFFHSSELFPVSNQTAVTVIMHGDLEKRLKMRGMDEQFNNLSTLKQIVEVLQLKGLLHSTNRSNQGHDHESSIQLKQSRSLASKLDQQRSVNDSRGPHGAMDRRDRIPVKARTASTPNRIESNLKNCNSIIKRKPLSVEIERKVNEASDSLQRSPIGSPRKTGSVHHSVTNRARNSKPTESYTVNSPKQNLIKNVVTDGELSSRPEHIVSTSSATDSQILKREDCGEGKRLLERCGKLLNSIEEMNSSSESLASSAEVLPSPVSVLDSGFDKNESLLSPSYGIDVKASPTIDFNYQNRSPKTSPKKSPEPDELISHDSDFIYITKIFCASQHLFEDPNAFLSIEKQLHNTENTSNVSTRHRKLVFDVTLELLNRNRELPPWKTSIGCSQTLLKQIWFEFKKLREVNANGGLLELITGVLMRDLVEIKGWEDYVIETSETILDIERMIFRDLVSEAIEDLVKFSGECMLFSRTRRRLVF